MTSSFGAYHLQGIRYSLYATTLAICTLSDAKQDLYALCNGLSMNTTEKFGGQINSSLDEQATCLLVATATVITVDYSQNIPHVTQYSNRPGRKGWYS